MQFHKILRYALRLWFLYPAVLAVTAATVGGIGWLTPRLVHLILALMTLAGLGQAVLEERTRGKAAYLFAVSGILVCAYGYSVSEENLRLLAGSFTNFLLLWGGLWSVLALATLGYLCLVLVRSALWSQEHWEGLRAERQARRRRLWAACPDFLPLPIRGAVPQDLPATGQDRRQDRIVNLLRLCTVLLAAVSFWATAQGMADYVFSQKWQAYAASLAVQGILLGLNFYLPSFYRMIQGCPARVGMLLLTGVVLFCSSWFSFVYIVDHVYRQSWDVESRLLIQSGYRQELYDGSDYAGAYQTLLSDALNQKVLDLYTQARNLESGEISVTGQMDWAEERSAYTGDGFAASTVMKSVIDAMEAAMGEDATADVRERATSVIISMKGNLESELNSLTQQIATADARVAQANTNLQNAQARLNNAPSEVDTTALSAAVESAMRYFEGQQTTLQSLENRRQDYQSALSRVELYELSLGLTEGGSANYISAGLRSIQQELFKEEPNLSDIENQAVDIFQRLQSAVDTATDNGAEYQELLRSTNSFISELRDYSSIKSATSQFRTLIEALRTDADVLVDGDWKAQWSQRLDGLKSLVGSLPAYSGTDRPALAGYSRAAAADRLDDMVRLYIADHNAAQQGIIYLFSPYSGLAWFSLLLALFLDIAAFITGLIIDVVDHGRASRRRTNGVGTAVLSQTGRNRYLYLSGDYTLEDGRATYQVTEEGLPGTFTTDTAGLETGLYLALGERLVPLAPQRLALALTADGPRDGIYRNCLLSFEDRMLTITGDEKEPPAFLANIDGHIPVYCLYRNRCEVLSADSLRLRRSNWAVVALNRKGSEVAAIYLV